MVLSEDVLNGDHTEGGLGVLLVNNVLGEVLPLNKIYCGSITLIESFIKILK